jgi:hypothetical protein
MILNKKNFVRFMLFFLAVAFTWFAGTSPVLSKAITIKMCDIDPEFHLTLDKTNGEFASTNIKSKAFKKFIESMTGGKSSQTVSWADRQ